MYFPLILPLLSYRTNNVHAMNYAAADIFFPEEFASSSSSEVKYRGRARFEFDDIDLALSNVTTVKFSQTVPLPGISDIGSRKMVTHTLTLPSFSIP